jgi:threonyl-tRNA synthetase
MEQIGEEISALFDFMQHTYGLFGFEFSLELSTRPEKFLGSIETWNAAEEVSPFCYLHTDLPHRRTTAT